MKKTVATLCLFVSLILSGCFDIFNETTINKDGSGVYNNTTNMNSLWGMLKSLGGKETDSLEKMNLDTVISIVSYKDSLRGLTETEKILIEKATIRITMNASEEIFRMNFSIPFSRLPDLKAISGLIKKLKEKSLNETMGNILPGEEAEDNPLQTGGMNFENSDPEEYFDYVFEKRKISRKLNKEKYTLVESDAGLKALREISKMGSPVTVQTIYNFPKPIKKAEGKSLRLSTDKKKVTVIVSMDDFFDNPEKWEFEIKY